MTAFVALFVGFVVLTMLLKHFTPRGLRAEPFLSLAPIESVSRRSADQANEEDQMCMALSAQRVNDDFAPVETYAQEIISPRLHYFAAWTDSGCLLGCDHLHGTVISAANCISEAGGYVVAVQSGQLRALNDEEDRVFLAAMYGPSLVSERSNVFAPLRIPKSVLS